MVETDTKDPGTDIRYQLLLGPPFSTAGKICAVVDVRELMGWVRNVVLINVYLDLENPGGSEFWVGGYMSQVREWGSQFTSNLGTRWTDPVTARRVPSK